MCIVELEVSCFVILEIICSKGVLMHDSIEADESTIRRSSSVALWSRLCRCPSRQVTGRDELSVMVAEMGT